MIHQTAPKLLAELCHHLRQGFQRVDEPPELSPPDAALGDLSGDHVVLVLGLLKPGGQGFVPDAVLSHKHTIYRVLV